MHACLFNTLDVFTGLFFLICCDLIFLKAVQFATFLNIESQINNKRS